MPTIDLQGALTEIRSVSKKRSETQGLIRESETALGGSIKVIADTCRPHCAKAAEKYNESAYLRIMTDKIRLSLDPKDNLIFMKVRLVDAKGNEPDEMLDENDTNQIFTAIRQHLNRRFREAGIPLRLGGVCVPSFYLIK